MKKITTLEGHLDKQYGKKGNVRRDKFDSDSLKFRLVEIKNFLSEITIEDNLIKIFNLFLCSF